jgi:cyclophilin family peptidyl-prolyl cis-trans isomerase
MKKAMLLICAALGLAAPVPAKVAEDFPTPGDIVAQAGPQEWVTIAPSDLLVMDLAPDAKGRLRRVVIQLMPPPFSQGWIGNIRKLAAAHWWDGTSVNRVQDNYVVQWGDVTEKKALPSGLKNTSEADFQTVNGQSVLVGFLVESEKLFELTKFPFKDAYASVSFLNGWPLGYEEGYEQSPVWPIHCYGMVGVGRNLSPDTGSGAELYTVIGHAPRHLDRNIALVGRVIEGIEHLSSLPRGTGALGFYESAEERVPIHSVRIASEMPSDKPLPTYEYLSTESESFAAYADARANRRDPFFINPAGGADICNIPVPVRRVK